MLWTNQRAPCSVFKRCILVMLLIVFSLSPSLVGIMASVQETVLVVPVGKKNAKKASAGTKKPKASPAHPPYSEMINEAIIALKERTGSSQIAIAKFIEEKQKSGLPANFKKLLLVQLKKLVASEKLVKVKNSYKLPSAVAKKSVASAKSEAAKAPAKKKPAARPKAVTKTKSASVKVKSTPIKAKAVVKPKPKGRPSKAAKKASTAKSPGKKAVGAAKSLKKTPVKAVKKGPVKAPKKPKSIKSPVKKAK